MSLIHTHYCNLCDGPVRFIGRKPHNQDGSVHWDICKQRQIAAAKKKGVPFEDERGSGLMVRGQKIYMQMPAAKRGPDKFIPPWPEGVLPWEEVSDIHTR